MGWVSGRSGRRANFSVNTFVKLNTRVVATQDSRLVNYAKDSPISNDTPILFLKLPYNSPSTLVLCILQDQELCILYSIPDNLLLFVLIKCMIVQYNYSCLVTYVAFVARRNFVIWLSEETFMIFMDPQCACQCNKYEHCII